MRACLIVSLLLFLSGAAHASTKKKEKKEAASSRKIGTPLRRGEDVTTSRRLSIFTDNRWKDRVGDVVQIPYYVDLNFFTPYGKELIESSIQSLANRSKVVRFVPRTSQAAYIHVVDKSGGCSSWIGKSYTGKEQELNLAPGCFVTGIIQHEFLHALGFHHEQARPDRDQFVTVNISNVIPKNRHNFDTTFSAVLGADYDYDSVMQYGYRAFAIDPNVNVITAADPTKTEFLGQRTGASEQDVIEMRLLYQCLTGPRTLADYQANLCTSDCKCWEGAFGCDGNDDACQSSLTCVNNECVSGGGTGGGTCTDKPEWTDSEGDPCAWYEADDNCALYGSDNAGIDSTTASESCCVCGGGSTGGGSGGDGGCSNIVGWVDIEGDSCVWYEENNGEGDACALYGDSFADSVTGKTANEACCVCGGGSLAGVTLWSFENSETPGFCLDVAASSTEDGANIVHYPCDGSPKQKWWVDSNYYIRSALDTNKCMVGALGGTSQGTNLILNDCFANDDRFVIIYYTDGTFRPKNDDTQCLGPSREETATLFGTITVPKINFWDCTDSPHQQWSGVSAEVAKRKLRGNEDADRMLQQATETPQPEHCSDLPLGWYDSYGDNCEWYSVGTRCDDYGSANRNFGKTANQACCHCGGGSLIDAQAMSDAPLSDPVPSTNECWDLVYDWTDNVGDSCVWYSQGNNCLYYGDEFSTLDGNANLVCCTCGGGSTTPPLLGDYIEEIPGCSDSPAHWTDVDNDGCDWYEEDDNCQVFGSGYAGEDGKTANEACCFCGGGYDPNAPRIVPNITTPCTDVLDWTDSGGDPCSWYETDDRCFRFGTANAGPDVSTAVESCCVCGGGAAPLCSDKADWTDSEGDPCSWYEIEDRCLQFGIANAGIDGTTASESCCVCGGSAPVCNDKAGWTDSFGDGCVWYLYGNHCDVYGNANEGEDGTTARESCCGCGGGEVQSDSCFDTPGWVDGAQDDCSWYELDGRCTTFGGSDVVASAVDGTTANEACCVCGGGSSGSTVAVAAAEAKSAQTKKKTKGWLGWLPGGFEP